MDFAGERHFEMASLEKRERTLLYTRGTCALRGKENFYKLLPFFSNLYSIRGEVEIKGRMVIARCIHTHTRVRPAFLYLFTCTRAVWAFEDDCIEESAHCFIPAGPVCFSFILQSTSTRLAYFILRVSTMQLFCAITVCISFFSRFLGRDSILEVVIKYCHSFAFSLSLAFSVATTPKFATF